MQEFLHHQFSVKAIDDTHGPAIMLEQQEGIEDTAVIVVHPWQLRAACEHLGIIANDPQAERTISTLQRRITALANRIDFLADYLANHSDSRNADLSFEQTYARATADIAAEFIANEAVPFSPSSSTAFPHKQSQERDTPANPAPLQNLHGSDAGQLCIDA